MLLCAVRCPEVKRIILCTPKWAVMMEEKGASRRAGRLARFGLWTALRRFAMPSLARPDVKLRLDRTRTMPARCGGKRSSTFGFRSPLQE
jgi:hypothetical protein